MRQKSNASPIAGQPSTDLVLESYGAGYALLRAETDRFRAVYGSPDDRVYLTDLGRRALAEHAVFGPGLTVAQVRCSHV